MFNNDIIKDEFITIKSGFFDNNYTPTLVRSAHLIFVKSGELVVKINEIEFSLKENNLISLLPWSFFEILDCKTPVEYIDITYSPIVYYNYELLCNKNIYSAIKDVYVSTSSNYADLFNKLIKLESSENNGYTNIIISNTIIEILITHMSNNDYVNKKKINHNIYDSLNYLFMNLRNKITLYDLKNIYFMSESSISRFLRDRTKKTFFHLLLEMRIFIAYQFLKFSNLSCTDIAKISGFSDLAHFSRSFKHFFNINPESIKCILSNWNEKSKFNFLYVLLNSPTNLKSNEKKFIRSYLDIHDKNFFPKTAENQIMIYNSVYNLLTTDKSITDIAFESGFNSTKTFNRNFKKIFSHNPSVFKNKFKIEGEL